MTLKTQEHGAGSRIVAAIEDAYQAVRDLHSELPEVVFITGTGQIGRRSRWGHFCGERWATANGRCPEILIAGECLAAGAEFVLETLLHEATHALAHARGVKDTSQRGRYHNRRFLGLAEQVGLVYPGDTPDGSIGYSEVRLTTVTAGMYAAALDGLRDSISAWLDAGSGLKTQTGSNRNNLKLACVCDRIIWVSRSVYEDGPIICGNCTSIFEET